MYLKVSTCILEIGVVSERKLGAEISRHQRIFNILFKDRSDARHEVQLCKI